MSDWAEQLAFLDSLYPADWKKGKAVTFSVSKILLLVAVLCFAFAAASVSLGSVGLVPLGLAFFAGSFLVS